jgi:hypothetical protein
MTDLPRRSDVVIVGAGAGLDEPAQRRHLAGRDGQRR